MAKAPITFVKKNRDQTAMGRALAAVANAPVAPTPAAVAATLDTPQPSAEGYQVGQVYSIPLALLTQSKWNARQIYLVDEVDELAVSLQKNGQDVPAVGYVREGRVVIVDGQKRFRAATSAGLAELRVLIDEPPANEQQEYEESRRINLARSTQTAIDDALRWRNLLDAKIYGTLRELAQALEIPEERVIKIVSIASIPENLLKQMQESEKLRGWTIAYEISKIFSVDNKTEAEKLAIAEDVIEQIKEKERKEDGARGMNKAQISALVKSKLEGPKTRATPDVVPVKFGGQTGELKIFGSRGQLDLSIRGLSEDKLDELRQGIEKILSGQLPL